MNSDVWTFRTPVQPFHHWMAAAVVFVLCLLLASPMLAQAIQPVSINGHIVWTNDGPPQPAQDTPARPAQSEPQFFYWSNIEKRWKPVAPASPRALCSARAVAGEVSSYIESRPRLDTGKAQLKGELAAQDPNYTQAAEDRSVSSAQIDRYINEAASRHHVDPNLVRALVKVESNFNPRAVSSKGAMGLMQLMPATARMYAVRNPFDAAQNVDAGVRHLKGLLDNFKGDVRLSLAAYNAGEGAVQRNGGIPPYTETRNYVKRITNLMAGDSAMHITSASLPIEVRRDDRGRLVISNTD
ncbi:MAG: lytic transglycosylase domain-containing protein [Candidatus Korobacteraceae bacterium]